MGVKFFKPPIMDTTIVNSLVNRPQYGKDTLLTGKKKCIYESLVQFDMSSLPFFLTILSGSLHLYINENLFSRVVKTINVHQILFPWDEKHVVFSEPVINQTPAASTSITDAVNLFLSFDITPLVIDWYTGKEANFGVLLKLRNEITANLIGFRSKDFDNSQFWPFLEVAYLDPTPSAENCCHQTLDVDFSVITYDIAQTTASLYIQIFNYTYFVINTGVYSATVYLEISPDNIHWQTQSALQPILPGKMISLVPDTIGKYARLTYQSTIPGQSTALEIHIRGSL